jgi:hypothetical protein
METSSLRTLNIIAKKPQRNCTFLNSASGDEAGAIRYKRLKKASDIFTAQKSELYCNVLHWSNFFSYVFYLLQCLNVRLDR